MSNEMPDAPVTETIGAKRADVVAAWQIANELVQVHYEQGAIDAFPIYSEEAGLEKFMLTRRLACVVHNSDLPDQFGTIQLVGDYAPRYVRENRTFALADKSSISAEFADVDEELAGHERCWHRYATQYPRIFQVVSELIAEYPEVSAAREIYVDKEFVEGTYHPLYLHSFVQDPMMVYDWFAIEAGDWAVFMKITGEATIFRSESGTWRFIGAVMKDKTAEELKAQFIEWLHLG